jgi:Phosphotransferase enzyme family
VLIGRRLAGSYNKAFRLTLDDSIRVVARLPCPLAGPSYLVTASEVATLQFAWEVLNIPVPRVFTWSGAQRNSVNRVGTDYIIMEEVAGVRLGLRWTEFLHSDEVKPILTSLLDVEAKFQHLRFSHIGSLYFKDDVSEDLQSLPLFSNNKDATIAQLSEKYRIGPLIDRQWWRGERARLDLDRGPCKSFPQISCNFIADFVTFIPGANATAYFVAAAKNEQKIIDQVDITSTRYRRHPLHDKTVHSKLLTMYLAAVPFIMPPDDSDICAPTLWHPDLSLGNLFVSETGPAALQGIIDWQHTSILPYFSFLSMPSAFAYEGDKIDMSGILPGPLPSDLDGRTPKEQAEYRMHLRLANRHKWYQGKSLTARKVAVLRLPHANQLAMLPTFVLRAWSDSALDLRHALFILHERWADIAGPSVPCPIQFSVEERKEHERQLWCFERYEAAMEVARSTLGYEGDGLVGHQDYDQIQRAIGRFGTAWEEGLTGSPFPFKDGEYSYFLS